ncbi:MAG: pyridoxamine 5'-phosphate oxidase [Planctomycetota bacterium]|nr:MAG: pyridoxamine 5'-phosphate oxidase [Planctomycetota bacterium]
MPSIADVFDGKSPLPDQLPDNPFPILQDWLEGAWSRKDQPNPHSMALATATPEGSPSVRMVLCKHIDPDQGYVVFYTNYRSRKGRELDANPRASVCFHWDHVERQVRIEGIVVRSPAAESDAYFASRPWESRIGAWASDQSEPIASRSALLEKVMTRIGELGLSLPALMLSGNKVEIPRPPHWGGYRLWATSVECWAAGAGRIHDRARWERRVDQEDGTMRCGPWCSTRLQP